MSFGVVLPLFRVAFTVMVLQLVELDVDPPYQIGVGSGIGIVETLLHQGVDVVVGTNSHRMTNCMNPVSDAFMVNLVQYQAVAEYLPSGEACPSIWWNHAIIAFCDVPFQIALSLACLDARRAFYGRAAALVGAFLSARFLVFEAFMRSRFLAAHPWH